MLGWLVTSSDDHERNELDALRLENDKLWRNLAKLEEKILNIEEQQASRKQTRTEEKVAAKGVPNELLQLDETLQWLHVNVDGGGVELII